MSDQKILKVTSMEDLVRASQGTLIELPAFAPDKAAKNSNNPIYSPKILGCDFLPNPLFHHKMN